MQNLREMRIAWSSHCNKNLCPLYNWGKANKETCLQVGTWCYWEKSCSKSETSDSLSGLLTLWQKGDALVAKFSEKRLSNIAEGLGVWVASFKQMAGIIFHSGAFWGAVGLLLSRAGIATGLAVLPPRSPTSQHVCCR